MKPDFQVLFESVPGLYLVLTIDLKIAAVSEAYLQATMTKRAEIIGRGIFDVFPDDPEDPDADGVDKLRASLQRVIKNKIPDTMAVQKYSIETAGGNFEMRYWSPVNSPVFKNGTKEIIYIIHRVEDVTDYVLLKQKGKSSQEAAKKDTVHAEADVYNRGRELQEANIQLREAEDRLKKTQDELEQRVQERTAELKKAQRQLVQQERLRALGEMASGIAHDFNNALSPILGYSELIIDGPQMYTNEEREEYLRMIHVAARDAAKIVARLRNFSRPREVFEKLAPVDVKGLIHEVVKLTQPRWKTQTMTRGFNVEFRVRVDEVPFIEGNEAELREALTNLIFNAVDALPKGGVISLRAYIDRGNAIIEISDTGTGMDEEVRKRCLEPFFTTKDSGTGLGLAMVYGIIKRHKGDIYVKSEPGEGTTFSICIPLLKDTSVRKEPLKSAPKIPSLRILCVDDDDGVRKITAAFLNRDGHFVDTAVNGADGLIKFYAGNYDLLVIDRAMPGMTGEQLALKVKAAAPDKPVLLLSGTIGDLEEGETIPHVDAVLPKPTTLEAIRNAISALVSKK